MITCREASHIDVASRSDVPVSLHALTTSETPCAFSCVIWMKGL